MSPSREGGGSARPSPLTIYKDSYLIRKVHSPPTPLGLSSSSSNSAASGGNVDSCHHHQRQQHQRRRPPVIIYTQSPKVIHTEPHDFMALVQKLTGMSRSSDDNTGGSSAGRRGCARPECDGAVKAAPAGSDDYSSSSTTTSEKTGDEDEHGVLQLSATAAADGSPPAPVPYDQYPSTNPFLPDVPIFTPTARYYCYPNDHFY